MGTGRPARGRRRPRRELPVDRGSSLAHRSRRRRAGPADQSARRLRRRRIARGDGDPRGARGTRDIERGPGDRRRDGRRERAVDEHLLRSRRARRLGTRAAPTCSTAARTSTTSTRRQTTSTSRSRRTSPSSTRTCSRCWGRSASPTSTRRRRWTARSGRRSRPSSPPCSGPARAREWVEFFAGHEVCFAPVLSMTQAHAHPHNVARGTFVDVDGAPQPAPAPRFSRTPSAVQGAPVAAGTHTDSALLDWGFTADDIRTLRVAGAIA